MNERFHILLDGEDPGSLEGFSPDELRDLAHYRRLQQEMGRNASYGGLSVAEKSAMASSLATAIGYDAPAAEAAPTRPVAGGGLLKSAATLLLGIGLGAGLFALIDNDDAPVVTETRTIGIAVESTTPSMMPFALPEPFVADDCSDEVQALRDSLANAKGVTSGPVKKKTSRRRSNHTGPVTGDPIPR